MKIGPFCIQESLCRQSEDFSSDDSFCLQMQIKSTQAETKLLAPQHLVTNLAYKLNPLKKKTKKQLAHNTKVAITTSTTDKINIVGSCSLFAVHLDTSKLK